jgi:hypothetical protein
VHNSAYSFHSYHRGRDEEIVEGEPECGSYSRVDAGAVKHKRNQMKRSDDTDDDGGLGLVGPRGTWCQRHGGGGEREGLDVEVLWAERVTIPKPG